MPYQYIAKYIDHAGADKNIPMIHSQSVTYV